MLGLNRKAIVRHKLQNTQRRLGSVYILGKGRTQASVCHLLVRIWLPWQRNHPQLQNIKKIFFVCSGGSNSKKIRSYNPNYG